MGVRHPPDRHEGLKPLRTVELRVVIMLRGPDWDVGCSCESMRSHTLSIQYSQGKSMTQYNVITGCNQPFELPAGILIL